MLKKWSIGDFNRGKHLPEEIKKKISLKKKQFYKEGKLKLPDNKGKRPWNLGRPHKEETKRKISEAKRGTTPWNKGIKRTEEEKRKISLGLKRAWERRKGF